MATVLITGGSGVLGRELAPRFAAASYNVRLASRHAPRGALNEWLTLPVDDPAGSKGSALREWAKVDLLTGEGLAEAVRGAPLIVHAASSARKKARETEVEGTRRLLAAAKEAGTSHFFYISIVGVDRIPFGYYKAKLAAEKLVEESGVPYSILRATQFHTLLDMFLGMLVRLPVAALPKNFRFQPIDAGEVAGHMVAAAGRGPAGRLPDLCGPETLLLGDIARAWLAAKGKRALVLPLWLPGRVAGGFRAGYNCAPEHAAGTVTWGEWLGRRYGGGGVRT